ncbi:MAG: 3' terminal RNA ribose 2'-O-methyltransferase Hen1 [Myxococcales bacterium]|nr:3' terminal RNA ribose 2'-O-methyltransferase Hen1 [Myxococcales bacterium]
MLLTISTTYVPATDLGYLLGKNPARVQTFDLAYGKAHVFYPEATSERCTAALALDIDPIGLVRGRRPGEAGTVADYVNDRPYVASSLLSVAIAQVYGSALGGKCRDRPELAQTAIPLCIELAVLPCHGGEALLRRLFEPLGYAVEAERLPLDPQFPEWGQSLYFHVRLCRTAKLSDVLSHLYVLIPVLDDEKHYWVGEDEVEKLIEKGEGWLETHPEKGTIALRYLKHRHGLARLALDRLIAEESTEIEASDEQAGAAEEAVERGLSLNEARMQAVAHVLAEAGATTVIDLGCGEGRLLRTLIRDKRYSKLSGVDVSPRVLDVAASRLRLSDMTDKQRERVALFQGALTYRDKRFSGYDAATLIEVIEHLDVERLPALVRVVFAFARPRTVVVTTPNVEYNHRFSSLPAGQLRHADHRFEWTRAEFAKWAEAVGKEHGYSVRLSGIGELDDALGPPTQLAVFALGRSEGQP